MSTILQTDRLTKIYGGKRVVDHVNLHIEKGDIYGFIGKNGAGKTTTMRMICGTAFPSEGSVRLFDGMPLSEARRKIGSLIEAPGLYPDCTALENMRRFAILFGGSEADIASILEFVGLKDTGKKTAKQFSLGMKQRLGIAIAMLGDPEFLILDEPVNGLDPAGMKEIRDLILKLNHERGTTFLISSHLLDELSKVATKFGIINGGRLVEELSAEDLQKKCRSALVISTAEPERARDILAELCDPSEIKIENGKLVLYSHLDAGAEINKKLALCDVPVSGIELHTVGLEEYFFERIGG